MVEQGTYVVTGSASGMGAAVVQRLRAAGSRVITVDLRDADVVADLSTPTGRRNAVEAVLEASDGCLDGAVCAAGLGPRPGLERTILEVNYLGVTELLEGLRPALARSGSAKVVVIGSNSTTTTPMVPGRAVRALLDGDLDKACSRLLRVKRMAPAHAYAASKLAVTHWTRLRATEPAWVGEGIHLNVLAPGAVMTAMLRDQLAGPEAKNVQRFPIPVGHFGDPDVLAQWAEFMLSPAADVVVGAVVVVDGGTEALFRARDWPRPVPARQVPRFVRLMFGSSRRCAGTQPTG
jgi:NAD(P)-dependent dehydrogenase (short-subunit alcohol dehydrogenase family)